MTSRLLRPILSLALAVAASACALDQPGQEPEQELQEELDQVEALAPAGVFDESTATAVPVPGEPAPSAAAAPICFTCDLDPSVHACSSIASRAFHICQRACVICDIFSDNQEDCFIGLCSPD